MAGSGEIPKADGDINYAKDYNMSFFQGALASTLNHASVNVGNTATSIIAANSSRKGILIYNNSSVTFYLGFTNSVTTGTGLEIPNGVSIYLNAKESIYGITASGTADARYLEVQ